MPGMRPNPDRARATDTAEVTGTSPWRDLGVWKRAAWTAAVPGAVVFAVMQVTGYVGHGMVGADSHAYWLAAHDLALAYDKPVGTWDAFLYSPAFAQVLWPAAQLGWPAFRVLWLAAQLAVTVWLVRPLRWWQGAVLALFVSGEFVLGNVYLFFAALVVLVVRPRPEALTPLALTKAAPAVLGLWYVARGQWRDAARGAVSVGVVVAVSAAIAPDAWVAWFHFLVDSAGTSKGSTVIVRLCAATVLVVVAARLDRSVLLAPAVILACPALGGLTYFAVLLSVPRLLLRDRARAAEAAGEVQEAARTPGATRAS